MSHLVLEPLHRFHAYCARFPSEIVEAVLEKYTTPGESIFDPFCGSGTTLVASLAHGRRAIGTDIDIVAGMLSEVQCAPRAPQQYARWRTHFVAKVTRIFKEIRHAWDSFSPPTPGTMWSLPSLQLQIPPFPELNYWFPPHRIAALAAIAEAARQCQDPHYERVALLSLSASIIAKWPHTLSYAMDVDHTRPHRRVQLFTTERVMKTYLARLDRSLACLGRLHEVYQEVGMLKTLPEMSQVVYPHDAREPALTIPDASQSLIMTSPPYFNAVDYPRAHRLSVCWMNGYAPVDVASRQRYIGLRHAPQFCCGRWLDARPQIERFLPRPILDHVLLGKRLCAFFADLEVVLGQVWRVLKPNGHAVFVIANNVIKGQRIASHAVLAELAKSVGFIEVETTSRAIASVRRRFPVGPFGFDGPMTHEYVVVLRKPRA